MTDQTDMIRATYAGQRLAEQAQRIERLEKALRAIIQPAAISARAKKKYAAGWRDCERANALIATVALESKP